MACQVTNINETELHRNIKNGAPLFELEPNQTRDTTMKFYEATQNALRPSELEYKGKQNRYTFLGEMVKGRVSDAAKNLFNRFKSKVYAEKLNNARDNVIKREGGTFIHGILKELVNNIANNKGNISDIGSRAMKGEYALSPNQFKVLGKTARSLVRQIKNIQKSIDPTQKVIIRTEFKTIDSVRDIGGAMDVFAIFSDNTGAIYDYKTLSSHSNQFQGQQLIDEIVYPNQEEAFELSMSEYKRQAIEVFGVASIRQSRIIPIHVRYENLPRNQQKDGHHISTNIITLEAGADMSEFLEQLPVAGEKTKYEGLNDLLEQQWALLTKFQGRLTKKKLSKSERDRLSERIKILRKSIKNLIINTDIKFLIDNIDRVSGELKNFNESEGLPDGSPNPKYLDHEALNDLLIEGRMYSDMFKYSASYFRDLKTENPMAYNKLREAIIKKVARLEGIVTMATIERKSRLLELIDNDYKEINQQGEEILRPMNELGFFASNFDRFSEINHPIFEAVWPLIQEAHRKKRKDLSIMNENISQKTKALHEWADSQNIKRQEAFNRMINTETGNLYGKLTPEFYEKRDNLLYNTSDLDEAVKGIKELYEITNLKEFEKEFDERAQNMYYEKRVC